MGGPHQIFVSKVRRRIHQLQPLLRECSPPSLSTKRLLYLSLIRPIWEYSCGLWGSAVSHIKKIQASQNRVLRMITGAPWYVRNSTLHNDLGIPTVQEVIRSTYRRLDHRMTDHENTLIARIPENPPPPPSRRCLRRKRPQDSLIN
uniref:Putative RNA-directed DNA polymerase from transposon X-element n=1 Tax=Lygus hesperus TaxID=30085 RepID=A0A0A9WT61_LYGHE